jgi:hypothetical protein
MESNLSRKLTSLIADAAQAGYAAEWSRSDLYLVKTVKVNKTTTRRVGLWITEDGTAFRLDVGLSVAAGIRSYKTMRAVLGISV